MPRLKKILSEKEKNLLHTISKAKKKLVKIKLKQKEALGELAYKCGLHEFDLKHLKTHFEKLLAELKGDK